MDNIMETIEGNESLASVLSVLKMIFRAILPLIGLEYFVKYFKDDEAAG